jgi:hypothetical protein
MPTPAAAAWKPLYLPVRRFGLRASRRRSAALSALLPRQHDARGAATVITSTLMSPRAQFLSWLPHRSAQSFNEAELKQSTTYARNLDRIASPLCEGFPTVRTSQDRPGSQPNEPGLFALESATGASATGKMRSKPAAAWATSDPVNATAPGTGSRRRDLMLSSYFSASILPIRARSGKGGTGFPKRSCSVSRI